MRWFLFMVWLVSCISFGSGCAKTREEDLQAKVDKCTAAGMNYTYMRDFKGDPYEVMCIPKRLR